MSQKCMSRRSFLKISAMTLAVLPFDSTRMAAIAAGLQPKNNYPVVVIGAGLGGLSCAAHLARVGIPVTVVEQHDIPGGYATSFDRAGGKFTFDVSLEGTSIHNNDTARMLKDLGVLDKLEIVPIPEVVKIRGRNFDIAVPQKNPEALITLLSKQFPGEQRGISDAVHEILAIGQEVDRLQATRGKFERSAFPTQFPKLWNIRNKSLAAFLDGFVKNPEVKNALSAQWGYYGLPPSRLSAFYYAVAFGEYLTKGSYYIKPRSQALSNALADVIEASGGKILYGTEAQKVLVENGAAAGVVVSGGRTLPARAVVSNASAVTTLKTMLPAGVLPPECLAKVDGYKPSVSTFLVWLGLNKDLRGTIKGYDLSTRAEMDAERAYQASLKGDVEKVGFGVVFYDSIFDGYSKPGTSTLKIITLSGYEPWRRFEADYRAGRKGAYNKEKERWTDVLIRRAEKELIPGLSSMIEVKDSASPLTNWYFTRNTEGAIYGFEQTPDNTFMTRINNRTPVKGLYLAGAWGDPGGGYSAVLGSGRKTFGYIMEDWQKKQ